MSFPRPRYRGICPLAAAGSAMSAREYEQWREAHSWDPSRQTELIVETDLAPAAWVERALIDHWSASLAMLPSGFDAYARLFHRYDGENQADRLERIATALTDPDAIVLAGPSGQADPAARCAFLPDDKFEALLPILARHTSTAGSWFLLWDGHGGLSERAFAAAASTTSRTGSPSSGRRGILPATREAYDSGVTKVIYRDADGSEISFGGRVG